MKQKDRERQEAIDKLRKWIRPGDTIYTILRDVSRSGMRRKISVVLLDHCSEDGRGCNPSHPNYSVAKAIGARLDRKGPHDSIIIGGCGFDAGFEIVYRLSRALFADGWTCLGEGCPSNDHCNGDRDYTPHPHTDPGYALQHRWL